MLVEMLFSVSLCDESCGRSIGIGCCKAAFQGSSFPLERCGTSFGGRWVKCWLKCLLSVSCVMKVERWSIGWVKSFPNVTFVRDGGRLSEKVIIILFVIFTSLYILFFNFYFYFNFIIFSIFIIYFILLER